jgi:hypothetical protein
MTQGMGILNSVPVAGRYDLLTSAQADTAGTDFNDVSESLGLLSYSVSSVGVPPSNPVYSASQDLIQLETYVEMGAGTGSLPTTPNSTGPENTFTNNGAATALQQFSSDAGASRAELLTQS